MLMTVQIMKPNTEAKASDQFLQFGIIRISRVEYHYLETTYPHVYTVTKLFGLSDWLEKHPKVVIDNFGYWVEKRFALENNDKKNQPTGLISRIDPNR